MKNNLSRPRSCIRNWNPLLSPSSPPRMAEPGRRISSKNNSAVSCDEVNLSFIKERLCKLPTLWTKKKWSEFGFRTFDLILSVHSNFLQKFSPFETREICIDQEKRNSISLFFNISVCYCNNNHNISIPTFPTGLILYHNLWRLYNINFIVLLISFETRVVVMDWWRRWTVWSYLVVRWSNLLQYQGVCEAAGMCPH